MQNLTKYTYPSTELFFKYTKGQVTLQGLVKGLSDLQETERKETKQKRKGLWFKFGKEDKHNTSIADLERDLALPSSHPNKQFYTSRLEWACMLGNEVEIYFY